MRSDKLIPRILVALLLFTGIVSSAGAQLRNRIDNRGREFRLAFLQTNGFDDNPHFYLDIWSAKATRGTYTYVSTGETFTVDIPTPYVTVRVSLDSLKLLLPNPKTTDISNYTLHVKFDDEVTLYGINTQRWSSDAFLGLPEQELGTHYIVMSYPNTIAPDPTGKLFNRSDFPSQFAVLAIEDNTTVNVRPTTTLSTGQNSPFTKLLNKGQIYFAQADNKVGLDLTGTDIISNKPVLVYGSHQRTNIPYTEAVGRDHLVEQLLPVNRWTNRAILTPHFQLEKSYMDANIARVIALNDNTTLSIDSASVKTLNAGEFVEIPLLRAQLLTATGPFQVAQFQHSTVDESVMHQKNDSIGDPFMMLAFAPEQYDSIYSFESYDTKDFTYHYINVVIPSERISTLVLDGAPVAAAFERIPKTSYSFAQIQVNKGFHIMRARVPFGLYIYGFGPYNSYGVPGAVVFDTLFKDQKPPLVRIADTCGGIAGVAYDDSTYDFGMESVRLEKGSTNVSLQTSPFKTGIDSVHFQLNLTDPFQDGYALMTVVDTAGLDNKVEFPVKGFTVSLLGLPQLPVQEDTIASLNGFKFCTRIVLSNYGRFPQTISGLNLTSSAPGLQIDGTFPVTLAPGEQREFSICYQHSGDTAFTTGLSVTDGCLDRLLAMIPVISGVDSLRPSVGFDNNPCQTDPVFDISELGSRNAGIKSITYKVLENADPLLTPDVLPSKSLRLVLHRRDLRKDLIYSIEIEDLVGNKETLADTLGGFTLAVSRLSGEEVGLRINNPWTYNELTYGDQSCDSVEITNFGLRPLALRRIYMQGNLMYSIPPEQLPFSLAPGEVRRLSVCFNPKGSGSILDTLAIEFECPGYSELVQLFTNVLPLPGSARDRCGNAISFQIGGFARRNFLEPPSPNPTAIEKAAVRFGLDQPERVTLSVHDQFGNAVLNLLQNDMMPGGIAEIEMDVHSLPQGLYYLRMLTANGDAFTQKLVVQR